MSDYLCIVLIYLYDYCNWNLLDSSAEPVAMSESSAIAEINRQMQRTPVFEAERQ